MTSVVINGWGQLGQDLADFTSTLAQRQLNPVATSIYELIGECEKHETPQTGESGFSEYAAAACALISGLGPVNLIGISTGGLVCLEAALAQPEKVARVVLISSTACFLRQRSEPDYPGVSPVALRSMSLGLRTAKHLTLKEFFSRVYLDDSRVEARVKQTGQLETKLLLHGLRYLNDTDLRSKLPKLTQHVLVVHGTRDQVIPYQAAKYIVDRVTTGRLRSFEECGHALVEENFNEVADVIRDFVGEC